MKNSLKYLILFLCVSLFLSICSFNGKCDITSTFPAQEGDKYTWDCTYCSPNWSTSLGVGSKVEVNINHIYRGSYMGAGQALIVNVTLNYYYKATNYSTTFNFPFYVVYDETLHYMRILHCFIILTPINLTLVADYIIRYGDNCTIQENNLNVDYGYNQTGQYTYNLNGFAIKYEYKEFGITQYIIKLVELVDEKTLISFGNYYILFGVIAIISIVYFVNKRHEP